MSSKDVNQENVPFEERIICRGRTGSQRSLAQAKLGKN